LIVIICFLLILRDLYGPRDLYGLRLAQNAKVKLKVTGKHGDDAHHTYIHVHFIADKSVIIVLTNYHVSLRSPENGYANKTVLYGGNEVLTARDIYTYAILVAKHPRENTRLLLQMRSAMLISQ